MKGASEDGTLGTVRIKAREFCTNTVLPLLNLFLAGQWISSVYQD